MLIITVIENIYYESQINFQVNKYNINSLFNSIQNVKTIFNQSSSGKIFSKVKAT
jgi:hypothetical protein